jgi:phosphatidate phosphatase PAH1
MFARSVAQGGMVVAMVVVAGCWFRATNAERPDGIGAKECPQLELGDEVEWRHTGSKVTVSLGAPHHGGDDIMINPGKKAIVSAKFAYGDVSKDLEEEDIDLWIKRGECGHWKKVATAQTDDDGRVSMEVPWEHVMEEGMYPYAMVARGDHSFAEGTVFVVPPATKVVVFDVDGTLTSGNSELIELLIAGDEPEMMPDASTIVNAYVDAGYLPVYLTGRMYFLREGTLHWMRRMGFPPGVMYTANDWRNTTPGRPFIGKFKTNLLRDLIDEAGIDIVHAYGNAKTDVCAYADAGIDPAITYIIGPYGGHTCDGHGPSQAVESYADQMNTVPIPPVR